MIPADLGVQEMHALRMGSDLADCLSGKRDAVPPVSGGDHIIRLLYASICEGISVYHFSRLLEIEACRYNPVSGDPATVNDDSLGRRGARVYTCRDQEIISRNASTRRPICPASDEE